MRIAQIAPLAESVPPKLYGGTERVVSWLTEELVELGHDVTLFASGDSITKAKLVSCWESGLRFDPKLRDWAIPHVVMLQQVLERADEFDILHFHVDYNSFIPFKNHKFVTTMHGRLDLSEHSYLFKNFPNAPLVGISRAQEAFVPHANWVDTIYHGLPKNLLNPVKNSSGKYLAFLGRISPEKGLDDAIRIAEQCNIPLKVAAKVDRVDQEYFNKHIKPLLSKNVEFIGEISDMQKSAFLGNAVALLMPIAWPEPFGLVMIESMACGTPVVAYNNGSVPEILVDGLTGFIVNDINSAVEAVKHIKNLSRTFVRLHFEERFTSRTMAEKYVKVYNKIKGD